MAQTSKITPAESKGQGRTPPAGKGCSCKRRQCIKNSCDCYQSMMVCTQFCRCVGCRNTEERLAVEPRTPSRNSGAMKGDRAAAKEVLNIPVSPVSNDSVPVIIGAVPLPTVMAPINIIPMEAMETDEVATTPDDAMDLQFPESLNETQPYQVRRLVIAELTKCFIEIFEEEFFNFYDF